MKATLCQTVNPDTISIRVPFRIAKRGGRKEMQLPEDAPRQPDSALIKALARAFRWKRMLETGEFSSIAELAEREGIAPSYITRVLRLTLLTPEVVERILAGHRVGETGLTQLLQSFHEEWCLQTLAGR